MVTVQDVTVTARFSYEIHGLSVDFKDRSLGILILWEWSFGDASEVSLEQSPGHVYEKSGRYNVFLRVTDRSGLTAEVAKRISLGSLDTKTISAGAGAVLFVVGFVFLFRGDGEIVRFSGVLVFVVGAAFFVSITMGRDLAGGNLRFSRVAVALTMTPWRDLTRAP